MAVVGKPAPVPGNAQPVAVPAPAAGDAHLVGRVQAGDERAFRALLGQHLPRMLATARRLLGDDSEAEDVAQEAFLRLWRHSGNIEIGERGLGPWLYRVTSNLALDRIRARKPQDPDALETLPVSPDQGKALHDLQVAVRVDQALQNLPERQRLALVLCHYEGLDMNTAGGIMGVTVEAVESLLARARRSLKLALVAEWRDLLPDANSE